MASQIALILIHPAHQVSSWHFVFSFELMRGWLGRGYGGGGRRRLSTYRYTVTTRMNPALRWAVMRAILMFHWLWGIKSQDSIHKPQPFWRERRAKAESSWGPFAYQPNALPLGWTGSHPKVKRLLHFHAQNDESCSTVWWIPNRTISKIFCKIWLVFI